MKMANDQRERIESYMTNLLHKSDRLEDKMDKAEIEGDMEKLNRLDAKNNEVVAAISSAIDVLSYLGCFLRYDIDTNSYKVIER